MTSTASTVKARVPLVTATTRGSLGRNARELWEHRELALSFARRDIRARYKQTALGITWAVLQPLSLMVIFTLVFSRFARIPSEGVPYPLFSYSALIFWFFFATSVTQGTIAMVANANLVRKIWFPRETLLLAVLIAAALDLLIASALFALMLAYYGVGLGWTVVWVVPLLAVQCVFTLGVICLSSAVNVYFRDVGHALPLALQLWMFATPIAYPISSVPERFQPLYLLNPMAAVIDGYRRTIIRGQAPDTSAMTIAVAVALVFLCFGYLAFKRAERTFADVI